METEIFSWSLIFMYILLWKWALNMLESIPFCQIFWHAVVSFIFSYTHNVLWKLIFWWFILQLIHLLGLIWGYIQSTLPFINQIVFKTPKLLSLSFFKNFKYRKFYDIKCWTKVKILIVEYSKENFKSGRNSKRSWKRHVSKFRINVPFSK